jgi:hypothetical protein
MAPEMIPNMLTRHRIRISKSQDFEGTVIAAGGTLTVFENRLPERCVDEPCRHRIDTGSSTDMSCAQDSLLISQF